MSNYTTIRFRATGLGIFAVLDKYTNISRNYKTNGEIIKMPDDINPFLGITELLTTTKTGRGGKMISFNDLYHYCQKAVTYPGYESDSVCSGNYFGQIYVRNDAPAHIRRVVEEILKNIQEQNKFKFL